MKAPIRPLNVSRASRANPEDDSRSKVDDRVDQACVISLEPMYGLQISIK